MTRTVVVTVRGTADPRVARAVAEWAAAEAARKNARPHPRSEGKTR